MHTQMKVGVIKSCSMARQLLLDSDHVGAAAVLSPFWNGIYSAPVMNGLAINEQVELLTVCGRVLTAKARAEQIAGLYDEAEAILKRAIRIAESADLPLWDAQDALANCYRRRGDYQKARAVLRVARALIGTDQTNEYVFLTTALCSVEYLDGKPKVACAIADEVAPLVECLDSALIRARFYDIYASALDALGRHDDALIKYSGAGAFFELAGNRRHAIGIENNIAIILIKVGRAGEAHEHINRALNFYHSVADRSALGQTLETRARAYIADNRFDEALAAINESIYYLESGDEKGVLAESYRTKGDILARLDRTADATESYLKASVLAKRARVASSGLVLVEPSTDKDIDGCGDLEDAEDVLRIAMSDDSLSGLGIRAQDQIVVVAGCAIKDGDAVAASYDGDIYTGIYFEKYGKIVLEADDDRYEDLEFDKKECEVQGKIVGYIKAEHIASEEMNIQLL